ncbi:DUF6455 family protein [Microvirga subterranea]|uniref:DUF6455 domain-containing protein n=1 Tax=Microvirga subterranea TaxID=186651 RepID=A0A370HQB3_9HYPH|nr:DUF6455 family protein [Microvirga subterranea]RDI60742.1 hypothetical protein DES45_102129 [Microvirga subterranea]
MFGAIGQRIQQNAQNFGDMMIHVGLDPDTLPETETAFARAIRRCLWCSHSEACREWLNAKEKGDRAAPRFCANATFFERNLAARPALRGKDTTHRGAERPDAALLAIGEEWNSAAAEYDASTLALDAAEERLEDLDPTPPEALFERLGDRAMGLPAARLHHGGRTWYAPVIALVRARSSAEATTAEARERLIEIISAYDAWYAARAAAEEASGVWFAAARDKAAGERVDALNARLVSTPARTLEGLRQKAAAAVWAAGGIAQLEAKLRESGQIDAMLAMSIIRDLLTADPEQ